MQQRSERIPYAPTFDPPLDSCPMCRSPRIGLYDHDWRGIDIWRCRRCGQRFMNPQYTDQFLSDYYAQYIPDFEELQSAAYLERRRKAKEAHFALLERYVEPGRLLSIGFGDGLELEIARQRGWSVVGWDVDQKTVDEVGAQLGIEVHAGDLFALPLASGSFDCVLMDQVIEHPKNPADFFDLSFRVLRPGGAMYIGTPNIGSISAGWKTFLGKAGLKRQRRGKHYDTWHHLFYYTPWQLKSVLERFFGFQVVVAEGDPKPGEGGAMGRYLLTRLPVLDSSFRLIARRPWSDGRQGEGRG